MGCLFGARLTPHADVTLIGHWPEQIRALREGPLRFVGLDGQEAAIPVRVAAGVGDVPPCDVALILTKASQPAASAAEPAQVLTADGVAVTLQNGLGNRETLAAAVGPGRATQGVTLQAASLRGPGVVVHGGEGPTHLAERWPGDPAIRALAELLARAGFETHVAADVEALLWSKLVVNAAINPLTAVLRVANGALLESEWARGLLCQAATEVAAIAAAQNVTLPFPNAAAQAEQVARLTARNTSSMLQDVLRGVETEIEAICGAVVRAAGPLGIETPTNRLLYALVKAVEETYPARKD